MSRLFGSDSYFVLTLFVPCFKLSCPCTAVAKSLHRPFPGSGTGKRRCRSGVQTAFGKTVSESDMKLVSSWLLSKLLRNIQFGIFLPFFDLSSRLVLPPPESPSSRLRVSPHSLSKPSRSHLGAHSKRPRRWGEVGQEKVGGLPTQCRASLQRDPDGHSKLDQSI